MLLKEYASIAGRGFGLRLARALQVTPGIAYRWINGEKPTIQRCLQISMYTQNQVRCEEMRPDIDWNLISKYQKPDDSCLESKLCTPKNQI